MISISPKTTLGLLKEAERESLADLHDVRVEIELMQKPLRCYCAWHHKNFGVEKIMREGEEPATHSICGECQAIFNASKSFQ